MWHAIKPIMLPVVVLAAEYVAIQKKWMENEMFIGFFVGLGAFWLLWAILGNKAIIGKMPWLREWAPFLDPSGRALSEAELRKKYVNGKTFRLVDIAIDGRIIGRTFDDCVILGPAVLAASAFTTMRNPHWHARDRDSLFFEVGTKQKDGLVVADDCTFNNCTFRDIGVAGSNRAEFEEQLTLVDDSETKPVVNK